LFVIVLNLLVFFVWFFWDILNTKTKTHHFGKFYIYFNFSSNLSNILKKIEWSENENVMIIDGENEIGLNEWNMEDEIINGNLQIKQNILE
jgi:ATP/ADP translocase